MAELSSQQHARLTQQREHLKKLIDTLDPKQLGQLAVASDMLQSEGEISPAAALARLEKRVTPLVAIVPGRTLVVSALLNMVEGDGHVERAPFEPDAIGDPQFAHAQWYVTGIRAVVFPSPPSHAAPLAVSLSNGSYEAAPAGYAADMQAWVPAEYPNPWGAQPHEWLTAQTEWGRRERGSPSTSGSKASVRIFLALELLEDPNMPPQSYRLDIPSTHAQELIELHYVRRRRGEP